MAAAGGNFNEQFKKFATKADHKEATSKDVTKWCKDAGVFGKNCNSNHLDISFSKCKTKGKPNITCPQMDALIGELAKMYLKDHKCDEAAAKEQIKEKMSATDCVMVGTKQSKVGGVDRMTDASKYTGAHKERFDKDGKGKGIEGRVDRDDKAAKGYVGGYKGEDTFDAKKK